MGVKKRASGWMIVTGLVLMATAVSAMAADPVITEKKAADVNGVAITLMALNNDYRQVLKQQGVVEEEVTAETAVEMKATLLESLINQELLYQECKKNSITANEQSVSESVAKVKESFETEAEYQTALKDANIQEKDLFSRIRRSLAINELVDALISQHVDVSEAESRAYYDANPDAFIKTEKVRASHILVLVAQDAGEATKVAAREKLVAIQRRVKEGEDFAQLAQKSSDCPSSANGGDLGYFGRGDMVQEFEDAAFALPVGSVSDIVLTQYGYHLIKVTDKIEAGTVAYETVKSDLEDFMKQQKISAGVTSLIETIRKDAKIETYL